MAKNDGLDLVLDRIQKKSDWEELSKVCGGSYYIKHFSDYNHEQIVEKFNKEIRSNFGHTLINVFRGKYDPDYIEIICEVADKLEIPCNKTTQKYVPWLHCYNKKYVKDTYNLSNNPDVEYIEDLIIAKFFELIKEGIIKEKCIGAWNKLNDEVWAKIEEENKKGKFTAKQYAELSNFKKSSYAFTAFVIAGELSGFAIYQYSVVALFAISKALGLGLTVSGAGVALTSALGVLLGPVGWGLAALGLVMSLGDTDWKKTIHTVFMIACLRKQQKYS